MRNLAKPANLLLNTLPIFHQNPKDLVSSKERLGRMNQRTVQQPQSPDCVHSYATPTETLVAHRRGSANGNGNCTSSSAFAEFRTLSILATILSVLFVFFLPVMAQTSQQPPANLPSETPDKLEPVTDSFDYIRRDVMIPIRDEVKLHAVILIPKGANMAPILLTRTPYDAKALTSHAQSAHLGPILNGYDNATDVIVEGGYIRVVEDVRGKYGSEGDYVMNRPLHGSQNPTPVDHSTDTYDTIDWLVKNVPETNGRVGILGISYDGFLPLLALVNPHPALKVAVPMNPKVDGWMGDDWFHNGAFRQQGLPYIHDQEATRGDRKSTRLNSS